MNLKGESFRAARAAAREEREAKEGAPAPGNKGRPKGGSLVNLTGEAFRAARELREREPPGGAARVGAPGGNQSRRT